MVAVTNLIMLLVAVFSFTKLIKFHQVYASQMATFIIIMGVSGCFGAAAHAMHYQFGKRIFDVVFFISNTLNLLAIFFCFRGSYTYTLLRGKLANKYLIGFTIAWVVALIIITFFDNKFVLIKIHAAMTLVYSLVVHFRGYKKYHDQGSKIVVIGISISFLSILVHSLHLSISEWFNYKDIAHVIVIVSLTIIYRGIKTNAESIKAH